MKSRMYCIKLNEKYVIGMKHEEMKGEVKLPEEETNIPIRRLGFLKQW